MNVLLKFMTVLVLLVPLFAYAQEKKILELPESEIYLFALTKQKASLSLSKGKNITHHQGYDNQPFFTSKSQSLLFTSQRDQYQTDIYEYFIESENIKQLTNTPEQEYTPKASPDNNIISFVREGGNPNQSLWQMNRASGEIRWALTSLEPVGYYDWNHKTGYIVLWVRYAHSLQLMQPSMGLSEYIAGNALATAPQTIPGSSDFSIVHRQMNGAVWIKAFDPQTRAMRPLVKIVEHSQDYAWMPSGEILMGSGAKLYWWDAKVGSDWREVADLAQQSITHITRLAVSPDGKWLALVAQ